MSRRAAAGGRTRATAVAANRVPSAGTSGREGGSHIPGGAARGLKRLQDSAPWSFHAVWVIALILLAIGLSMMLSVSTAEALAEPAGGKFGFVRSQLGAAALGGFLLLLAWRLDYRRIRPVYMLFTAVAVGLLVVMHIPGVSSTEGGAASWILLGSITIQPSEFAKLAIVLAGAHLLSVRKNNTGDFKSFMMPFGLLGILMCILVLLEPDLGTTIIIGTLLLAMLWLAGMKSRHWILVAGTSAVAAIAFTLSSSIRMARIFSFLDPSKDPFGASHQLNQSLVALGRGGWFGVGPGQSVQKFSYLPKAHTDMIFAIWGEEFGLVGALVVILAFAGFAFACWRLARQCLDPMGKYLVAGCGMLVTVQAVVNIGGVIGALPLTGVPLPFISYGRNSLVVMLLAVGLILSVARHAPAAHGVRPVRERYDNVTYIDRRRRDSGTRGARIGAG